jgi:hypothetical protein
MKLYNIIETRRINGIESVKTINNMPMPLAAAVKATSIIATDIEGNDSFFGGYRDALVNKGTEQEAYVFGWDGDTEDLDLIEENMGWGVGMVGNKDFELSYKIEECEVPITNHMTNMAIESHKKKHLKHFICINTATCIHWAVNGEQPQILSMDSITDFENLGFDDGDWRRFIGCNILEVVSDFDYEGVYVMRID